MRFLAHHVVPLGAETHRKDVVGEPRRFAPDWRQRDVQPDLFRIGQHFDPREAVWIRPHRVVDAGEVHVEAAAVFFEEMRQQKAHLEECERVLGREQQLVPVARRRRDGVRLGDELVGEVQVHSAFRRHGSGEDDEEVEAARDLPAPQIARRSRPPVVRAEPSARATDGPGGGDDRAGVDARFLSGERRRELGVQLLQRADEVVERHVEIAAIRTKIAAPVHPRAYEFAVVQILVEDDASHREQQGAFRARVRGQPHVGLGRRVRQPRIDDDERRAVRLPFDDPLCVRIEVVAGLEMRREEQDRLRVRVVGRGAIVAAPQKVSEPCRGGADVGVAVVPVEPPCLQHAVRVAVLAGTADVIHDFVPTVLENGFPDSRCDVVERLTPRHLAPFSRTAFAVAGQRIEDAIRILDLVRRDDAFGARAAAAARVHRIALDLPDRQLLLVDVCEDSARRLAVEADARDDPVVTAIFFRPARRLVIDVVVPLCGIGVRAKWHREFEDLRI